MNICILTQTAKDISNYYKTFFKGYDLFFVTFKEKNENAIDFLPKSTWSEGRNRLWQEVKGKYDYYLFIDDDLEFQKAKFSFNPYFHLFYQRLIAKENTEKSYNPSNSSYFFYQIKKTLQQYEPEVLSVRNLNNLYNKRIDRKALRNGSFVRRLGWFDAQFTLYSDFAANRLLPYDTIVSGWSSAQILIYLLSFHVFRDKAITLNSLGVNNAFHSGPYVTDYKSNLDCKNMIELICQHTKNDYFSLFDKGINHVNLFYGEESISDSNNSKDENLNYQKNFEDSLKGLENLMPNNNLNFR